MFNEKHKKVVAPIIRHLLPADNDNSKNPAISHQAPMATDNLRTSEEIRKDVND